MYRTDEDVMRRVEEHLNAALAAHPGLDWFTVVAQGSWNYGMADEESDVDTKMLTLPSLNDLVFNRKSMNKVFIVEPTDEHCDMKDTREYFKIFRKSNINFVEILFSKYYIVNPDYADLWNTLRENAEFLARMNPYAAVSCMKGMALEKRNALCHEYPSRMPWIKKFGYDPKQLHHIARIDDFITKYVCGYDYVDCLYPNRGIRDYLLQMKRNGNGLSKEDAIKLADKFIENISLIADAVRGKNNCEMYSGIVYKNENNPEAETILDSVLGDLMKRSISKELGYC